MFIYFSHLLKIADSPNHYVIASSKLIAKGKNIF